MPVTRHTLIERIDRFIRSIESRHAEPDRWEGHCIKQALADIREGHIERAEAQMILAKTPPNFRVSQDPACDQSDHHKPTTAELRIAIEHIKSQTSQ